MVLSAGLLGAQSRDAARAAVIAGASRSNCPPNTCRLRGKIEHYASGYAKIMHGSLRDRSRPGIRCGECRLYAPYEERAKLSVLKIDRRSRPLK